MCRISRTWSLLLVGAAAGAYGCDRVVLPPAATEAGVSAPDGGDGGEGASQRMTLRTDDGWTLSGELIPEPGTSAESVAVLLVHRLTGDRSDWAPLMNRIRASHGPITALAIDLRGHGESLTGPEGHSPWQSFSNDPSRWAGIVHDVAAAAAFLEARNPYQRTRLVIVAAGIGATAALQHAASDPDVSSVVLLSPGLSHRGLDAQAPMARYVASGRTALLYAGAGDIPSADAVSALAAGRPLVTPRIFPRTDARGTALGLALAHPTIWSEIEQWVRAFPRVASPDGAIAATEKSDAGLQALDSMARDD